MLPYPYAVLLFLAFFRFENVSSSADDDEYELKWNIDRLKKLNFSMSPQSNFFGTRRSNTLHLNGVNTVAYFPNKYLPNIDVEFFIDNDGISQCKYRVYKFEELANLQNAIRSVAAQYKPGSGTEYSNALKWATSSVDLATLEEDCESQGESSNQVCLLPLDDCTELEDDGTKVVKQGTGPCQTQLKTANGIFNEPYQQPQCISDFYLVAEISSEYELLRYCSKAYLFQGWDYNQEENTAFREDWILYLMEGKLECILDNNRIEQSTDLLEMGYKVRMVQFTNGIENCESKADLSQYEDNARDGEFLMAGIIGSARLENYKKDFWMKEPANASAEGIDPLIRPECQQQYWETMRDEHGQYIIKLVITHYCTMSREASMLNFDLSIDPAKATGRVMDNPGVTVDLAQGKMYFASTKSIIARVLKEAQPN